MAGVRAPAATTAIGDSLASRRVRAAVSTIGGCLAAGLIAGCSGGASADAARVGHPGHNGQAIATGAVSTPTATSPAAGSAAPTTRAELRLASRLTGELRATGARVGALVESVTTGQVLFSRDPTVPRPPASLEKLYTTVAAVNLLGPTARFQTDILGSGVLSAGIWTGNLFLRGGGDPTLGDGGWNRAYENGDGPTAADLAAQLRRDGIRRVTGHIFADESLFDPDRGGPATHNRADTPDYAGELSALVYDHGMSTPTMTPAIFAAHELALTLRSQGMQVGAAARTAVTPASAVMLARVDSPPLSTLLRLMDVRSDDLIAEMLAKQLGAHMTATGTLAAGAAAISHTIGTDYGLHPVILDGSGLDPHDSSTPNDVVTLLRRVWLTATGRVLGAALPVVGKQGTVQSIAAHTAASGHCLAKTGTLNDVTNLAGYCKTRGGAVLVFALMIDGPPNDQSVGMLSRAVATIARY